MAARARSSQVAAVDLGASSGRVILGTVTPDTVELREVQRFVNQPVELPDGLHWDALRLYAEMLSGLRGASTLANGLDSIGIDSWGVDYGLVDDAGVLLNNPVAYRDARHAEGVKRVEAAISPKELYAINGLQFQPFNTVYQLAGAAREPWFAAARTMLLMPDLLGFWLTGVAAAERTNASTTGLLDARSHAWDLELAGRLGLPTRLFAELRDPGDRLGSVTRRVSSAIGHEVDLPVTLVGSHDTASAVVAVPAADDAFAYVSCGTWSLVGVELSAPVVTDEGRRANFTNEAGVDGRVRYLRNVMGLWLLQESMRTWEREGIPVDLDGLLASAASLPPGGPIVDAGSQAFLEPGDMPARIRDACRASDQRLPETQPEVVRCILDSLAAAHAQAVSDATRLTGRSVRTVHIVGGGSQNRLLCQLTADACGLPVVAGPVEATTLGNVLVQARALGTIEGDLERLRALVRSSQPLEHYEPQPNLTHVDG